MAMIDFSVQGTGDAESGCLAEATVVQLVEGSLNPAAWRAIHQHMASCDSCRELVAQVARSLTTDSGTDTESSLVCVAAVSEPAPGSTVGRYAIVERIGFGGTGIIYRAQDPQLQRDVALKLLRPVLSSDDQARARLLREAQALARLAHPNVVSVFDAGTFDDQVFVAMELVDGHTLKHWLGINARTVGEILEIFKATAHGLEAAHSAGLVHRDFKPSNVLVGRDGRPRVLDFGLAHASSHDAVGRRTAEPSAHQHSGPLEQTMTITGALLGTPAYMSPEQFLGQPTDARTDQFSFCVALYEALCGERPFAGGSIREIKGEVIQGKQRPIPSSVPSHVARALARGLQCRAADRFPSMSALIEALGEVEEAAEKTRRGGKGVLLAAALGVAILGGVASTLSPGQAPRLMTVAHRATLPVSRPASPTSMVTDKPKPKPKPASEAQPALPDVRAAPPHRPRTKTPRVPKLAPTASAATSTDTELIRNPWGSP